MEKEKIVGIASRYFVYIKIVAIYKCVLCSHESLIARRKQVSASNFGFWNLEILRLKKLKVSKNELQARRMAGQLTAQPGPTLANLGLIFNCFNTPGPIGCFYWEGAEMGGGGVAGVESCSLP